MHTFRWLSDYTIPPDFDLRRGGWKLVTNQIDPVCPSIAPIAGIDPGAWVVLLGLHGTQRRRRIMLTGVDDREERAHFLRLGFGDVVGRSPGLGEIEARVLRISNNVDLTPRYRQIGTLRLDLIERDGIVGGQRLNLHPREFALIWRLSETPGKLVSKSALLADVWRLSFIPYTNSLAVHIFRLRAKLSTFGFQSLVQTHPSGGYVLEMPDVVHDYAADDMLLMAQSCRSLLSLGHD